MDRRHPMDLDDSIDFFLGYCDKPEVGEHNLILRSSNEFALKGLSRCWRKTLLWANRYYQRGDVYLHLGENKVPLYKLPQWLLAYDAPKKSSNRGDKMTSNLNPEEQPTGIDIIRPYLVEKNDFEVLEFVKEKIADGLIVIITSQIDDRCRYTSKSLTTERAFWTPSEFFNYKYTRSWDIDRIGHPYQGYHDMRDLLRRDGYIPGYEYLLRRPGDNALVKYSTDYYHVADGWCGEPVRIGVSRPEDYTIIQIPEPQQN